MQQQYNRAAGWLTCPRADDGHRARCPGRLAPWPALDRAQGRGPTPSDGHALPAAAVPTGPRMERGPNLCKSFYSVRVNLGVTSSDIHRTRHPCSQKLTSDVKGLSTTYTPL